MILSVDCHSCGKQIRYRTEHAGKRTRCPQCSNILLLPPAPTAATPKPPAKPPASPLAKPKKTSGPPPLPKAAATTAPAAAAQAAPNVSLPPLSCFSFYCPAGCGSLLKAFAAYRGKPALCPSCKKVVEVPTGWTPPSLFYVVIFFAAMCGLMSIVLAVVLFGALRLLPEFADSAGMALVGCGFVGGGLLGWYHRRRNPMGMNDWLTNEDLFTGIVHSYQSDPRVGVLPPDTPLDEKGKPTKRLADPGSSFTPGRWSTLLAFLLGFLGFFAGATAGVIGGLDTPSDAKEDFPLLKSVVGGAFCGFFSLAFIGWLIGVLAGTVWDLFAGRGPGPVEES